MMEQKITEVVAALIVKDHRFLICQRPAHKARGLLWEFVGGKVEPGETLPQALIRECREELGIRVTPQEIFMQLVHIYPDITVRLTLFWTQTQDTRSVWSTTTCAGSASMKSTIFPSVPPTGIFWRSSKKWNSSRKIRSASTLSRPASSIIPLRNRRVAKEFSIVCLPCGNDSVKAKHGSVSESETLPCFIFLYSIEMRGICKTLSYNSAAQLIVVV